MILVPDPALESDSGSNSDSSGKHTFLLRDLLQSVSVFLVLVWQTTPVDDAAAAAAAAAAGPRARTTNSGGPRPAGQVGPGGPRLRLTDLTDGRSVAVVDRDRLLSVSNPQSLSLSLSLPPTRRNSKDDDDDSIMYRLPDVSEISGNTRQVSSFLLEP